MHTSIYVTTISAILLMLSACQEAPVSKSWSPFGSVPAEPKSLRRCFTEILPQTAEPRIFLFAAAANVGELTETFEDVERFQQAIQRRYTIPESQQCLLENVRRQEFEEALQKLATQVRSDDRVIIYFSGHGSNINDNDNDEGDGCDELFITYDVEEAIKNGKNLTLNLDKDTLKDDRFHELLEALPTNHVLTVVDACFSGGMQLSNENALPQAQPKLLRDLGLGRCQPKNTTVTRKYKGVFLAAAQEDEFAWSFPTRFFRTPKGGVFTFHLAEQLQKTPKAKFSDIFARAAKQVQESTKNSKATDLQKGQHPQQQGEWQTFDPFPNE